MKKINSNLVEIFKRSKIIDLTHVLDSQAPTWNGNCGFEQAIKQDYEQGCRVQNIKMHAGVGTHLDAPSHFIPGAASVAEMPLEQFVVPACVIDVSLKQDPYYEISVEDILHYEQKNGEIMENSFAIRAIAIVDTVI